LGVIQPSKAVKYISGKLVHIMVIAILLESLLVCLPIDFAETYWVTVGALCMSY